MGRKKVNVKKIDIPFDKYWYYHKSVQSPEVDVEFFQDTFKAIKKREAKTLREDFCGTFAITCEWVKLGKDKVGYGVDLDPEPIAYGRKNYLSQISADQQKRVHIKEGNVLDPKLPKTDMVAALNFSYYLFKMREDLIKYFKNVYETIKKDGLLIADCFGGSKCMEPNEEETENDGFSYFWDQDTFDPITNEAMFHIHFKIDGQKKIKNVFTYDWRMWTIPELREIMREAGFKKTTVYWEGTTDDGEGDGEFTPAIKGEDCEAWVAYIMAEK